MSTWAFARVIMSVPSGVTMNPAIFRLNGQIRIGVRQPDSRAPGSSGSQSSGVRIDERRASVWAN